MDEREQHPGEQDRRYWRRRYNRRVRKARRARSFLHYAIIGSAQLALATMFVLAGVHVADFITETDSLALRQLRFEGFQRGSAQTVRDSLGHLDGHNLLSLDLRGITGIVASDRWVRDASVRRELPHTLVVRVQEREPAAIALIAGIAHLVDDQGVVIGACGPRMAEDLPVLVGFGELEGDALAAAIGRGVDALAQLAQIDPGLAEEIAELDLGGRDRVVARLLQGPPLLLDPQRVERNVEDYLALRTEIGARVATVEYVDLRWRERITVGAVEELSTGS